MFSVFLADLYYIQIFSDVEHFCVDFITGNFYFVDNKDEKIFVCNITGGMICITILEEDADANLQGLAVDPLSGYVSRKC